LLADAMLDNAVPKEVASKNWWGLPFSGGLSSMFGRPLRSANVGPVPSWRVDRRSMRYAHRRRDEGDVRSRLREIALERRRFGHWRLGIKLAREGIVMEP